MRFITTGCILFTTIAGAISAPAHDAGSTPDSPPLTIRADSDTAAALRDSLMRSVLQRIAGKETLPADSVFVNVKRLGTFQAGTFVRVMGSFSRALGVSCGHCHVVDKWDADDKPQKQIAREMWAMMGKINTELLPAIPNLHSPRPTVNCTTCHRGQVKPALDLP